MTSYNIEFDPKTNILTVGFGEPAQNNQLVIDADKRLQTLINEKQITGGEIIKINGPASLPVAMVIAHKLTHLYQAIAVYDPKLSKYVVSIAHGDKYAIGDLLGENI